MDSGVTTYCHDSSAIKTLCNSAVMIHAGKIYTSGLPNAVIIEYLKLAIRGSTSRSRTIYSHARENIPRCYTMRFIKPKSKTRSSHQRKPALIEEVKLLNFFRRTYQRESILGFNESVTLLIDVKVYKPFKDALLVFLYVTKWQ